MLVIIVQAETARAPTLVATANTVTNAGAVTALEVLNRDWSSCNTEGLHRIEEMN